MLKFEYTDPPEYTLALQPSCINVPFMNKDFYYKIIKPFPIFKFLTHIQVCLMLEVMHAIFYVYLVTGMLVLIVVTCGYYLLHIVIVYFIWLCNYVM